MSEINIPNLAYILKSAREDSDLSQMKVMKLTGINNKTLSGYENGISEPDFKTLITLFRLYGLSFDLLISSERCISEKDIEAVKMYAELPEGKKYDLYIQIKALYEEYCK